MRADVRHPGVATLLGDLSPRAAQVLCLQRAGSHSSAHGRSLLGAIEVREPALLGHALQGVLELLGVGVLKAPPRDDVGVVHDHVGVRYVLGVVVVVDDGNLVIAEVLARPGDRNLAEGVQAHVVLGVRREHVVLVGAARPASPGRVVSPTRARVVHCRRPVEGDIFAVGDVDVQVVGSECAPVLGEVAVDALAGRVPGYGLQEWHGLSPTGRAGAPLPPCAQERRARLSARAGAPAAAPLRKAPPGRRMRPWPLV